MKKIKILTLAALIAVISGTSLNASPDGGFRISGMVHMFQPTDGFFKDIYGGGMAFGGEIGVRLSKGLSLWAAADIFNKKGTTTYTGEETELRIIPLCGGLMVQFMDSNIQPYLGLGIGYFLYKETNPIGEVTGGDMGFVVQAGVRFHPVGPLFFDAKGSYSFCKSKSADIEAELGGLRAGLGIGLAF